MLRKLAFVASLALLAVATPAPAPPASQCNTAPVQCCESSATAGSKAGAGLLALVGAVVQDPSVLLGTTCSPISVVGVGSGATCSASPLCCTDNSFKGLVAIGCTPVDISL